MLRLVCSAALVLVAACSASSAPALDVEPAESESQGLATHCRTVCPKCPGQQVCPLGPCYLECTSTCTQTQLCIIGYVWDTKSCSCVPGH